MMRNPDKFQKFSSFHVAMATVLSTQPRITHTRTQCLLHVFLFIKRTDSSSKSRYRVLSYQDTRIDLLNIALPIATLWCPGVLSSQDCFDSNGDM